MPLGGHEAMQWLYHVWTPESLGGMGGMRGERERERGTGLRESKVASGGAPWALAGTSPSIESTSPSRSEKSASPASLGESLGSTRSGMSESESTAAVPTSSREGCSRARTSSGEIAWSGRGGGDGPPACE